MILSCELTSVTVAFYFCFVNDIWKCHHFRLMQGRHPRECAQNQHQIKASTQSKWQEVSWVQTGSNYTESSCLSVGKMLHSPPTVYNYTPTLFQLLLPIPLVDLHFIKAHLDASKKCYLQTPHALRMQWFTADLCIMLTNQDPQPTISPSFLDLGFLWFISHSLVL